MKLLLKCVLYGLSLFFCFNAYADPISCNELPNRFFVTTRCEEQKADIVCHIHREESEDSKAYFFFKKCLNTYDMHECIKQINALDNISPIGLLEWSMTEEWEYMLKSNYRRSVLQ